MLICNKCGKTMQKDGSVVKEDYLSIYKEWGYFSKKDGLVQEALLCEECAEIFFSELNIPPKEWIKTELI